MSLISRHFGQPWTPAERPETDCRSGGCEFESRRPRWWRAMSGAAWRWPTPAIPGGCAIPGEPLALPGGCAGVRGGGGAPAAGL